MQLDDMTRHNISCLTLNNLGCLYNKLNYGRVALEYFLQVLRLEELLKADSVSLASTMLNICSNLSRDKKHKEAEAYAARAILLLNEDI